MGIAWALKVHIRVFVKALKICRQLECDAQGAALRISSATAVGEQQKFYLRYGAMSINTTAVINAARYTKGWIVEWFDPDTDP